MSQGGQQEQEEQVPRRPAGELVLVIGAIWYLVAWQVNKNKGVNLALAYREIPPE